MKKTKLATAVSLALAGSAGVLNTAHAVNVNPDGLGEVLLYPYYTVRNGQNTLISLVNTRDEVKAVKVRFLEGKNTREVLDFNLYLSPFDVWTGAVVRTDAGARLITNDNSCTVPTISEDGEDFRNFTYVGNQADGEDTSLNRTREGHLEIIEMGVVTDTNPGDPTAFNPATAATHVSDVPADCSVLEQAWSGGVWATNPSTNIVSSPGGLFGHGLIINVAQGAAYSYQATALDNFFIVPFHTDPGTLIPSLEDADTLSDVFISQQGTPAVVNSLWSRGLDSASSVLMHNSVMNHFVTDPDINAATDWVITFPTKRFHISVKDLDTGSAPAPTPPFTENFMEGGACEPVGLAIWNREERPQTGGLDFSPQPPGGNALCWETNVISFNDKDVLGSELGLNVDTSSVGNDGWMRLTFTDPDHQLVSEEGNVFIGLPVIGFAVQEYVNGVSNEVLTNYGGLFEHAFSRQISGVQTQ
ncbi:hypothetical protein Nhal_3646 [Nitrosococcus halophilus Nc 4]|uniref:Uncharacterized protein n=1 Tax=Nitrosococcus halophilus (strain Nc4) TaxID=472759 RepID=D5C281_NITHN|nr:hypothetical protein [Nitrosococcus halophilus]ADE16669.1 hypothetical protein Nhal_3646 [Nitrosococcus halophilus Nc 4]